MMDSSNPIFEPDVVLSAELFSSSSGPPTPERGLLLAALEDAARGLFRTCTATDGRARTFYEETRDWFASTEHARLFDFENICHVFGFDPTYVRKHVFARCAQLRAAALAPTTESRVDDEPSTDPDLDLLTA
jgi:hypothetical protein